MTGRIALIVDFRLRPGQRAAFLATLRNHIALSLATEPGCLGLDVLLPRDDDDRVILLETYTDQAALDAHSAVPRLAAVRASYQPLIVSRSVEVCTF